MPLTLGMVYDRVRWEEKLLLERARTQGLRVEAVDAKNLRLKARVYNGELGINFGDVVLQRCISHYRGLHVTAYLEAVGLPSVCGLGLCRASPPSSWPRRECPSLRPFSPSPPTRQ
ncbi:MAG: hypothetical protein ACE5OO_06355 [Candidatus Bathyarchaeia archaeon]